MFNYFSFKELIQDCQEMEWKSMASLQFLNLVQSLIINNGLFGVSLYCAYLVTSKELTVGDFALVGTYFMQLMGPLNFIGTVYRMIQE
jgi:ABC-type transport system involved in Fe-S cluster assembly fused permease/ATPase subunit